MASKKNIISRQGYDKILSEINEIKDIQVPETLNVLKDARAQGDLSENSDYHAAKEKLALLQKRIDELEMMIASVEIIDDEDVADSHLVKYGSKVLVEIEDDKQYLFEIAGSGEVAVFDELRLSLDSPIGVAIEGKKKGDISYVKLPNGNKKKVTILSVD